MNIELCLPLRSIYVTQPFGCTTYNDFYKDLNLKGHNGIDLLDREAECYNALFDGYVTFAGPGADKGLCVMTATTKNGFGYGNLYYHLKDIYVRTGDRIQAHQKLGVCDNTGKYTTGDHLHFELFLTQNGEVLNRQNGYNGRIDPAPYFVANYNGRKIKNKDWDKSNAYHRYYRSDRNFAIELKVATALTAYLKRLPTNEEINACVYGAWDREALTNPGMRYNWAYITKGEWRNGVHPFSN